jgi:NADPH:quinone reductase-like Zn-dependent oxidoreductase
MPQSNSNSTAIQTLLSTLTLSCLQEPGSKVLVAGATGGVGQLATAKLLEVRVA